LWLSHIAVWAVRLAAQGAIVPALEQAGPSAYGLRWVPALVDRVQLDAIARKMPAPAGALDDRDARAIALEVLGATVHAIAAGAAARLELPAPPPVVRTPGDVAEAVVTRLDGSPFE